MRCGPLEIFMRSFLFTYGITIFKLNLIFDIKFLKLIFFLSKE